MVRLLLRVAQKPTPTPESSRDDLAAGQEGTAEVCVLPSVQGQEENLMDEQEEVGDGIVGPLVVVCLCQLEPKCNHLRNIFGGEGGE